MNTEVKTLNRFEKAGFNVGQSKAMVVGIDDLLVKSMAVFNHRMDTMDHRMDAIERSIDHRFSALENSLAGAMRFQAIGLVSVVVAILIGFTGLIYALLR